MWAKYDIEPEEIEYEMMAVRSPGYPLRPEIVESTYYLYHYTRDPKYLRHGRNDVARLRQILSQRRRLCRA